MNKENLRIFIITQNEPFYLPKAISYFLKILPKDIEIIGSITLQGSPFGKKITFWKRAKETLRIFGIKFFLFYACRFLWSKIFSRPVSHFFKIRDGYHIHGSVDINSPEIIRTLTNLKPDIIISIASNQIFRSSLLSIPKVACLNLHTGSLPKYRGLMPLFWAMSNDEATIGVTVFEMDKGLDSGPIVKQCHLPVADFTLNQLITQTKYLGMHLLVESLVAYRTGKIITKVNDDLLATKYSFPDHFDVQKFRKIGKKFF